jgi:hypothetical protein
MLHTNAKKFLSKNPTLISTVAGVRFYECPIQGEDVPLRAITKDGKLKMTDFYESPDVEELGSLI